MKATATASSEIDLNSLRVFRRPAWWAMCFGLGVLLLGTAWEYSFPDNHFTLWILLIACWATLSICWAAYVLIRAFIQKSFVWFRWPDAAVGACALVALAMVVTSMPFEARFRLSERAMNADAAAIMSNPSRAKQTDRIGHWSASDVQTFDGGMRFLIPEIGWLDPVGFAYSANGKPPNIGGEDIYHQQSDHWWIWQESW